MRAMTNQYLRPLQVIFILCLMGMTLWFLFHTHTAVPHGDDFCYGIKVNEYGLLGAVWNEYHRWGGRFSSALLVSLAMQDPVLITYYVWVIPLFILIALGVSVRFFLVRIGISSLPIALALYVAVVASINWWESILWLTGGITYGLSFAVFILLLGVEIKVFVSKEGGKLSSLQLIIFGVLSIFLAGFNEVIAVTHVVFLALCFISIWHGKADLKRVKIFGWLLVCALLGLLIVKFAPGNDVRMTFLSRQMITTSAIKSFLLFFDQCMVAMIVSTLFFMSVFHLFRFANPSVIRNVHIRPLVWFIPLSIMAAIFVRMYTGGWLGPLRAQSIDFLLSTLEGLLIALLIYKPNISNTSGMEKMAKDSIGFILALSLISLFPTPDGKWWHTLRQQYSDKRYQQFFQPYLVEALNHPGSFISIPRFDIHELKPGQRRPRTIWDGDFTSDPADWTNQCFTKFYRLRGMQIID